MCLPYGDHHSSTRDITGMTKAPLNGKDKDTIQWFPHFSAFSVFYLFSTRRLMRCEHTTSFSARSMWSRTQDTIAFSLSLTLHICVAPETRRWRKLQPKPLSPLSTSRRLDSSLRSQLTRARTLSLSRPQTRRHIPFVHLIKMFSTLRDTTANKMLYSLCGLRRKHSTQSKNSEAIQTNRCRLRTRDQHWLFHRPNASKRVSQKQNKTVEAVTTTTHKKRREKTKKIKTIWWATAVVGLVWSLVDPSVCTTTSLLGLCVCVCSCLPWHGHGQTRPSQIHTQY